MKSTKMVHPPKVIGVWEIIPKAILVLLSNSSNRLVVDTRLGDPMPFQARAAKILTEAPSSTIQRAIVYGSTLTFIWKGALEGRRGSTRLSQSKEAIWELGGGWSGMSSVPPCSVSYELVVKKMWQEDTSLSKGRLGLIDNGIDSTALWKSLSKGTMGLTKYDIGSIT